MAERAFVFRQLRLAHEALFPIHDLIEAGEGMKIAERMIGKLLSELRFGKRSRFLQFHREIIHRH